MLKRRRELQVSLVMMLILLCMLMHMHYAIWGKPRLDWAVTTYFGIAYPDRTVAIFKKNNFETTFRTCSKRLIVSNLFRFLYVR